MVDQFPEGTYASPGNRLLEGGGGWTTTWLLSFIYEKYSQTPFWEYREAVLILPCPP